MLSMDPHSTQLRTSSPQARLPPNESCYGPLHHQQQQQKHQEQQLHPLHYQHHHRPEQQRELQQHQLDLHKIQRSQHHHLHTSHQRHHGSHYRLDERHIPHPTSPYHSSSAHAPLPPPPSLPDQRVPAFDRRPPRLSTPHPDPSYPHCGAGYREAVSSSTSFNAATIAPTPSDRFSRVQYSPIPGGAIHAKILPPVCPRRRPHRLIGMETYFGFVRTPQDAILLFEACRLGRLHRVHRRLTDNERQLIRPGSVFIWDEIEAGMRRWTDGKSWSASRVSGSFLTYREMEGRKPNSNVAIHQPRRGIKRSLDDELDEEPSHLLDDAAPDGYRYKLDGLVKQSFSITTKQGVRLHLISYFTRREADGDHLSLPSSDPFLADINPLNGLYPETTTTETISFSPSQLAIPPSVPPVANQIHRIQPFNGCAVPPRGFSNPHPTPFNFPGYPSPTAWTSSTFFPPVPPCSHPTSYPTPRETSSPTSGHSYTPSPVSCARPVSRSSSRPSSDHASDFSRSTLFGGSALFPLRSSLDPIHSGANTAPSQSSTPTSFPSANSLLSRVRPYSSIEPTFSPRSPVFRPLRRTPTLPSSVPRRSNSSKVSSYCQKTPLSRHSSYDSDRTGRIMSPRENRPCSPGAPLPGIRALLNDENKFGFPLSSSVPSPTASSVADAIISKRPSDNVYCPSRSPEISSHSSDTTPPAPMARPISGFGMFRNLASGQPIQLPYPSGCADPMRDNNAAAGMATRCWPHPLGDASFSTYSPPSLTNHSVIDPTRTLRHVKQSERDAGSPSWSFTDPAYVLHSFTATPSFPSLHQA